mmetsp:Transcript_7434/g.10455  ORF Transcript_7434/g.10455 Transcript_7434/m.10455 type:complete len:106 (-) Transcript_7434:36-353(-)
MRPPRPPAARTIDVRDRCSAQIRGGKKNSVLWVHSRSLRHHWFLELKHGLKRMDCAPLAEQKWRERERERKRERRSLANGGAHLDDSTKRIGRSQAIGNGDVKRE